ncbi:transmembrane protein 151B-like [Mya arenaria]|uniref:transmembrane protein 151B-like n=1 Tax=Mya arenaria TaxID=6604 RepID=UPI0022E3C3DF|nr:transmembrane protein 151B-like [Mya arenaria]
MYSVRGPLAEHEHTDDSLKQRPVRHTWCQSLRHNFHFKNLILTLLIYGCLGAIAWCRLAVVTTVVVYNERYFSHRGVAKSSPCADGYIYIPVAFVILLYLVYLVECWHCHTRIELRHKCDVQTVYHKMRQMREALPIAWWKALCYHYVRRTRQVTRYRNGDAFTSTQVYYERVNSHTAGCAFNFTNCGYKDTTKVVTGLEDYQATKIRFSKTFSFLHPDAKYEFDEQRNQFFMDNERRDDYLETREGLDLLNVNFKEYMIAFKDPDNLPWYVSNVVFWISSFLLMSWPLRILIDFKTAYIHYHVHKVFGTKYVNSDINDRSQIRRVNTVGSVDLESIVRNNFTIVPSYSQALLMTDGTTSSHTLHDANANITSPVVGPTRSTTWNNISQSTSSGYISGFFSSANISNMPNSISVDGDGIVPRPRIRSNSLHRSLRDLLRSPWTRRKAQRHVRSNTMFMLSSPDSVDEYSLTVDQQLMSVYASKNHSSFSDVSSPPSCGNNASCSYSDRLFQSGNKSCQSQQTSLLPENVSGRDKCPLLPAVQTNTEISTQKKNIEAGCTSSSGDGNGTKSLRPLSIAKPPNDLIEDPNNPGFMSKFVKSNLPKVPIPRIICESYESVNFAPTPSSPPGYDEALHMQRPCDGALFQDAPSETSGLLPPNSRGHGRYCAIMETSL